MDLFSATQYLLFLAIVTALVTPWAGTWSAFFPTKNIEVSRITLLAHR
jgi:hypothetical protein